MTGSQITEDQARQIFADEVNEEARFSRLRGPDPDCKRLMADIEAEHEAECRRMEAEQAQNDDGRRRSLHR